MRLRLLAAALSLSVPAFAQEPAAEELDSESEGLSAVDSVTAAPVTSEVPDAPPREALSEPEGSEAAESAAPASEDPSAPSPHGEEVDVPAPVADEKSGAKVTFTGAPGEGFTLKSGDRFSLNVRSRIQLRYQFTSREVPGEARVEEQVVNIGTLRVWLGGNVLVPELTYLIQLALADRDYRDGATSPVYDAYIEYQPMRDLNFRAGQFFVPFDRLRTVREWALQMTERPRPVAELTLDRDVGVMAFSDHFLGDDSPFAYRAGVFGGGGPNLSGGKEPGALLVGRLEFRPLGKIDDDKEGDLDRRTKPGIALGGAFAANINTNRQRSTTGATYVGGVADYLHAAADVVFKWRGFAFQAEYLWKEASEDTIVSTTADGSALTEFTRSGQGWVLQASYAFEPPLEVVGRLSRLYASEGTDPALVTEIERRGQEVGFGLNYYLNGHKFKLQADYIGRMPGDFDFSLADHGVRAQLDATF